MTTWVTQLLGRFGQLRPEGLAHGPAELFGVCCGDVDPGQQLITVIRSMLGQRRRRELLRRPEERDVLPRIVRDPSQSTLRGRQLHRGLVTASDCIPPSATAPPSRHSVFAGRYERTPPKRPRVLDELRAGRPTLPCECGVVSHSAWHPFDARHSRCAARTPDSPRDGRPHASARWPGWCRHARGPALGRRGCGAVGEQVVDIAVTARHFATTTRAKPRDASGRLSCRN